MVAVVAAVVLSAWWAGRGSAVRHPMSVIKNLEDLLGRLGALGEGEVHVRIEASGHLDVHGRTLRMRRIEAWIKAAVMNVSECQVSAVSADVTCDVAVRREQMVSNSRVHKVTSSRVVLTS